MTCWIYVLRLRKWVLVRTCSLDQVLSEVGETGLGARVLEAAAAKNAKGHAKRAGHCCGQSSAPGGCSAGRSSGPPRRGASEEAPLRFRAKASASEEPRSRGLSWPPAAPARDPPCRVYKKASEWWTICERTYKRRQGVMRIRGTAGKATYAGKPSGSGGAAGNAGRSSGGKRQLSAGRRRLGLALSTASRAAVVGVAARATRSVGRAWSRARLDRAPATTDSEEIMDDLEGEGLLRPSESPPVACFSRASEVRLSSGRSINNALTAPTKPLLVYSCNSG